MSKKRKPLRVHLGDHVLIGRPGTSMPADWYIGTVEWAEDDEVLIRHGGMDGNSKQRGVYPIDMIRAAGPIEHLFAFRAKADAQIGSLKGVVREHEAALEEVRKAVWAKLDQIAELAEVLR